MCISSQGSEVLYISLVSHCLVPNKHTNSFTVILKLLTSVVALSGADNSIPGKPDGIVSTYALFCAFLNSHGTAGAIFMCSSLVLTAISVYPLSEHFRHPRAAANHTASCYCATTKIKQFPFHQASK